MGEYPPLPAWAGDDYVWVEDRDWLVPSIRTRCRGMNSRCPNTPVADLPRGRTKVRWGYCADHLYSRPFVDGKVLWPVHPDSTAAKQGWVGGNVGWDGPEGYEEATQ